MRGRVAPLLLGAGVALGIGWRMLQQAVPGRLDAALSFGLLFIVLAVLHIVVSCTCPTPTASCSVSRPSCC